jgi:hypothetical protein
MEQEVNEVPLHEQALMAIKLQDSVRELIKSEVIEAFQDDTFMRELMQKANYIFIYELGHKLRYEESFKMAIKEVIINQLNNSA